MYRHASVYTISENYKHVRVILVNTYTSGILYPWYEAVQGGTYWYVPVHPLLDTRRYEKCQNCTYQYIPVRTDTMTFLWQYILVCTGTYCTVRGGTREYKEVHGGTRNSTRRYETVCTGMYWYVLVCTLRYKEVQASTRRYMVVQGTVQGGTRRYVLVCTGTYWYVPISAVQPGYAALLLDSLLQFCPAESAVLQTSVSNQTIASSSVVQSRQWSEVPKARCCGFNSKLKPQV